MKKYNNLLGSFLSGSDGRSGYNAGYRRGALNELYSETDPAKQYEAAGQLARVDPESANKWKQDNESVTQKHAQLLVALGKDNPVAIQAWQTRIKPQLVQMYGEQAAALPDVPDDSVMQYAQQLAGRNNAEGDTRWIQTVGKDGKPVWAAANNRGIAPTEYGIPDSYSLEIDPANGLPYSHSKRTGAVTPAGGGARESADPMIDVSKRIEQGIQVLKANNIPAAQINAWAEGEFQKGQQSAQSGGYVGMSAADKAGAEANAKNQSELDYANKIAQAKFDAERANAPGIAGATESAKIEAENNAKLKAGAPQAMQKSLQLYTLIDKAIKHPGREAATGASAVLPWGYAAGTDAKDFMTVQKQLEGKAFLEAFESLKGGGQITQVEGEKATQAMARLDRAQSEGEYVAALNELKVIAATAYKRAKDRMGGSSQAPSAPSGKSPSAKNSKGWSLHTDANGNKAYVSPDGKQFEEVN